MQATRRRHTAVWFQVVIGPAFSRCGNAGCSALLMGTRCWRWREDGRIVYGCGLCCFAHARLRGVGAA